MKASVFLIVVSLVDGVDIRGGYIQDTQGREYPTKICETLELCQSFYELADYQSIAIL